MKSIFYGLIYRKQNHIVEVNDWVTSFKKPVITDKQIHYFEKFHECDIDGTPLQEGENIFLDDIEVETKITRAIRIVSGGYKYECNHILRYEDVTKDIDVAMREEYDVMCKKYEEDIARHEEDYLGTRK
jgi:hypothetical protein